MNKYIKLSLLWSDIKEAVSGTERDFTNGSIGRAIFILSIPMIIEMVMESVFAIVDIFFVSKLGAEAVTAVGITETILSIIYALSFGLSIGTVALVSRRIGEKKNREASTVAINSIFLAIFISMIIGGFTFIHSEKLLILMGAEQSVIEIGGGYARIMFGTNIVIMLLFVINAIFRSAGDAAVAMRVLWIANGINIILDPILILGWGPFPKLGVEGAAIATVVGRGIGVLYQILILFRGTSRIKIKKYNFIIKPYLLWKITKLSIGGVFQNLIVTVSWIFLVRVIASFGSVVVAGYTIAIRILIFTILPSHGMSNAAATLTGQNLGANQPARAEKTIKITALINLIFLSFIALFLISFSEFWISLFIDDENVIINGAKGLKYISLSLFAYSIGMIIIQAFNGSGKTEIPIVINIICFWLIQIPVAYFLGLKTSCNEIGVYIAIVAGDFMVTLIGLILFLQGKWKLAKV